MGRTWTPSQEAAMNLGGKALLVSAAAGSGKTSVLTERIIRSLINKEHPADLSRILVVTFTRAAAAELKARIAAALTDALAEDPGNKHLSHQLLLLGNAQISTIDSFFQKIVHANFEQLGLPATFRIADESEIDPICHEVMDGLLEEFYRQYMPPANTSDALGKIRENPFAEALDHLLSNRSDGKLNSMLLDFLEHFSSAPEGIDLLQTYARELRDASDHEFMKTKYGIYLRDYLQELFRAYHAELLKIRSDLEFDPAIAQKCAGLISSDLAYCNAMLEVLNEESYERLQAVAFSFIPGRFPTIKDKPEPVLAYQTWRVNFRKQLSSKVQEKLSFHVTYLPQQLCLTADLLDMLYLFFREFESRMKAEKYARGILEYNDIRSILYRLLSKDDGTASEFAHTLASQYDAVYIDEYQDVDMLQDRIFALIGENRRFMVGDIKQSIYGFRGSEPSIFANYRRIMPLYTDPKADDSNGICVFMSDNFRCDRPVIDFANRICGFLFSACEKSVGYRKQDDLICSKTPPQGVFEEACQTPVQLAVFDASSQSATKDDADEEVLKDEAVWIASEISRLIRSAQLDDGSPITCSDIAILVQAKKQGKTFAKALKALNIPVKVDAGVDYLHEPLMTDLLNLLRAIDNPYRDLPLSEFLLSPFGSFTLEELTAIRKAAPDSKALYDAMLFTAEEAEDSDIGKKAASMCQWLDNLRAQATILPADRFLRLLYLDEILISYANDPILLFLYEQARVYQRSSWCGLYGFLSHVERLLQGKPVSADGFQKAESAVTIMTIHHSKGLEFPVVFLGGCGAAFNRADTRENLLFHRTLGCASKLYDRDLGNSETTILRELLKLEIDTEQTEESIRTLYVALTRARERLYVTGTLRGKWENALSAAATVSRQNRYSILFCNSYLAWILAVLQNSKEADFPCTFRHISSEEVEKEKELPLETEADREQTIQACADPIATKYTQVIQKNAAFEYSLSHLQGLPTKVAASKLCKNLLDVLSEEDNENTAPELQLELMRSASPSFESLLKEKQKPSATDIGTATHAFLEFCDYQRLGETGIEREIDRLVEKQYLNQATAAMIHRKQLELFCQSNLFDWILSAKRIYREQKFSIYIPFSGLTTDLARSEKLDGQQLFVQGSIDLLLQMPDDRLLLIDYKTDKITDAERQDPKKLSNRMSLAHGTQLACYKQAVKELFGRAPDATFIYSLPLGSAIEITTEEFF